MRLVLVTGKGGVGKTTTAAATALRLADRGVKTLLLSTDPAHSPADALDVPLAGEPAEVAPGLWGVQVDTRPRFEAAWRQVQDHLSGLLARGGIDLPGAEELTVLPGTDQVFALLAVYGFAQSGDWDALVVDCAPTAETLRLLALPEDLGRYLQKVFPLQRRLARTVRPFAALFGRGETLPPDTVFEALQRLGDDLAALRQLLSDPASTSVRLVLTPEAVVTAEARRAFTALALYGCTVDLVVANRVLPAGDDPWLRGWADAQQEQLAAVRAAFAGVPVRELAYRAAEPVGAAALREVADDLYGALPGRDPAAVTSSAPLVRVEADGGDHLLRLALPLAERGTVEAARAGDDLVIDVGPHRRVLALPDVLRPCTVQGGRFDGAELIVRFRPDPTPPPADGAPRRPRPGSRP